MDDGNRLAAQQVLVTYVTEHQPASCISSQYIPCLFICASSSGDDNRMILGYCHQGRVDPCCHRWTALHIGISPGLSTHCLLAAGHTIQIISVTTGFIVGRLRLPLMIEADPMTKKPSYNPKP